MLSFISLFMVVFPNYKFSSLFDTWNIIKSNLVGTIACMPPHAPCTRIRFIFSVSPIETKLYAHPSWDNRMHASTCVLCPNSCTPFLGDHIGQAHMVPKVGVISCMLPHAPCTSRTIRVCRRAGLKVVFLDGPTKWSQTLCIPKDDHGMHAWQVSFISDTRCIF